MKIFNPKRSALFFLTLSFFVFCGFGSPKLSDIETAIMEKDFKSARNLAEDFIKRSKSPTELNQARYYLGVSELGLLQYEPARAAFKEILRANPSAAGNLHDRAWLGVIDSLGMEEKFEEALSESEKFLKERPNSEFLSVIYLKLGRTNLKLSRWDTAQEYLQKLVRDFPNSLEVRTAQQLLAEKRYFAIQVGSFLDQSRATKLADELKEKGEYAYLVETTDKENRPFYRVRVGQLSSLEEARQMKQHLSSQGYPTHIYP